MYQNIFQLWEKYLKLVKCNCVCSVSLDYFCSLQKRMTPLHRRLRWGNLAYGGVLFIILVQSLWLFFFFFSPHPPRHTEVKNLSSTICECKTSPATGRNSSQSTVVFLPTNPEEGITTTRLSTDPEKWSYEGEGCWEGRCQLEWTETSHNECH